MPVSVEARAIRVGERLADVYLSTTHMPDEHDVDLPALVARILDVPYATIVSQDHLRNAFAEMPRLVSGWDWDSPGDLFLQFLRALALGNFARATAVHDWDIVPFLHPAMLEELYFRRRGLFAPSLGPTRSRLALDLVVRMATPQSEGDDLQRAGIAALLEHQVPLSSSPTISGMTLRQIADKARYVVLVPLAAGASHTVEAVYKGDWTAAILTAATSGGAAVIFAGSLWIADRLFGGVKHLDTPPTRSPDTQSDPSATKKKRTR